MRRSATASTCISFLAAALAAAGDEPLERSRVAALELEAKIAQTPAVYLLLDPSRRILEVRSRGTVLDAITLEGVEIVSQQHLLARRRVEPMPFPAVWLIKAGPGDTDREVVAPTTLRPAPKEGEEDEPEPSKPAATPPPTPTPIPEPPPSYRAQLDNGYDLWITDQAPPESLWERLRAAVHDGWDRLRGFAQDLPPAIALEMKPEDARRLKHLVKGGTVILLATEYR